MDKNYCFEVHHKIECDEREKWKLYIDAIYKADSSKKTFQQKSYLNYWA